jgi:hypothetical protein
MAADRQKAIAPPIPGAPPETAAEAQAAAQMGKQMEAQMGKQMEAEEAAAGVGAAARQRGCGREERSAEN